MVKPDDFNNFKTLHVQRTNSLPMKGLSLIAQFNFQGTVSVSAQKSQLSSAQLAAGHPSRRPFQGKKSLSAGLFSATRHLSHSFITTCSVAACRLDCQRSFKRSFFAFSLFGPTAPSRLCRGPRRFRRRAQQLSGLPIEARVFLSFFKLCFNRPRLSALGPKNGHSKTTIPRNNSLNNNAFVRTE